MKRRQFRLRHLAHFAEHFAGRGLIKSRGQAKLMDGFEQPRHAGGGHVRRVAGDVKADAHVALRAKIIDFIRTDFFQQADERPGIGQDENLAGRSPVI